MNIVQLYDFIEELAITKTNVNSYFRGDIYTNWNTKEIKYSSVNAAVETIDEYENYEVYNVILYYGDRLVEGGDNRWQVQSEAVRILKDIIKNIRETYGELTFDEITETVTYNLFDQKFADYLAGAWCRVRIAFPVDVCADEQ
jgi:hypothetical protein